MTSIQLFLLATIIGLVVESIRKHEIDSFESWGVTNLKLRWRISTGVFDAPWWLPRTLDFVFENYFGRPYDPPPADATEFLKERWSLGFKPKCGVQRPNHGLVNAIRKLRLVPVVIQEYIDHYDNARNPDLKRESFYFEREDVEALQMAIVFESIGRRSEIGFSDDEKIYGRYRDASIEVFDHYSMRFLAPESRLKAINGLKSMYNEAIDVESYPFKRILEVAHDLDMVRTSSADAILPKFNFLKEEFGNGTKGAIIAKQLFQFAAEMASATGDRVMADYGPQARLSRGYDCEKYAKNGKDAYVCLETVTGIKYPPVQLFKFPKKKHFQKTSRKSKQDTKVDSKKARRHIKQDTADEQMSPKDAEDLEAPPRKPEQSTNATGFTKARLGLSAVADAALTGAGMNDAGLTKKIRSKKTSRQSKQDAKEDTKHLQDAKKDPKYVDGKSKQDVKKHYEKAVREANQDAMKDHNAEQDEKEGRNEAAKRSKHDSKNHPMIAVRKSDTDLWMTSYLRSAVMTNSLTVHQERDAQDKPNKATYIDRKLKRITRRSSSAHNMKSQK